MSTPDPPPHFEPIAVSSESTVVAQFVPDATSETGYQSEADLERALPSTSTSARRGP